MAANVDEMRVQQTAETVTQMREFLMSYNKLSEWCFNDCIADFTTRKLSDHENKCATNCMDKYLKMTQRVSQRLQEHQAVQMEAMQQAAAAAGATS